MVSKTKSVKVQSGFTKPRPKVSSSLRKKQQAWANKTR